MKRIIDIIVLAVVLVTGLIVAAKSVKGQDKVRRVFCIAAEYVRISPTEWVGLSNCGITWKVVVPAPENIELPKSVGAAEGDEAEAYFWDNGEGSWNRLDAVPALGDTLGYIDMPAEGQ